MPASCKLWSTGAAAGISPARLARSTTPSVPMTAIPCALAASRPSLSSRTALEPAICRAHAMTAVSPGPNPHSNNDDSMTGVATRPRSSPQPRSMAWRAGSSAGPTNISSATSVGSSSVEHSRSSRSSRPTCARRITGEALTTHVSLKAGFPIQFVGLHLHSRDAKLRQGVQKLAAGQTRKFRGPALGHAAKFIPLRRRRDAHLTRHACSVLLERRQGRFRDVDLQVNHHPDCTSLPVPGLGQVN